MCGFARANRGRLCIGTDDAGNVVGLKGYNKLMDDLSDKIKSTLGIAAEVNLLKTGGKHHIGVVVPPYSVPISLRGRYYYRSGSVNVELTGSAQILERGPLTVQRSKELTAWRYKPRHEFKRKFNFAYSISASCPVHRITTGGVCPRRV